LGEEDELHKAASSFFRGEEVGGGEVGDGGGSLFHIEGAVKKDV
jgi:hypothetical protein